MPYQKLEYSHIQHPVLQKVLLHSDMMLHDLYNVFKIKTENNAQGGGGSFSIAVVLLCTIDGLSVYLYPTKQVESQEKRFKLLLRKKLPWGATSKGWVEQGLAAKQFYLEFRNPLVHMLGTHEHSTSRKSGHLEPCVGKWGAIPESAHDIDLIQAMDQWNDEWPILRDMGTHVTFSGAAMWWAVRKMINELISDQAVVDNATKYLDNQSHASTTSRDRWCCFAKLFRCLTNKI